MQQRRRVKLAVVVGAVVLVGLAVVAAQFSQPAAIVRSVSWPLTRAVLNDMAVQMFSPLSGQLRAEARLDYTKAQVMLTDLNGEKCSWIVVPLAEDCEAFTMHRRMGVDLTWEESGPLPLGALYFIPGENDLVQSVPEGEPLLIIMRGWGDAILVNQAGEFIRKVRVETYRGEEWKLESVGVNAQFHGIMCHFTTCGTASLNEIR